jgi:hypothetical protein
VEIEVMVLGSGWVDGVHIFKVVSRLVGQRLVCRVSDARVYSRFLLLIRRVFSGPALNQG